MEFSRQVYWSGLPFPSLGGLPGPGIESVLLASSMLAGGFFHHCATWEDQIRHRQWTILITQLNTCWNNDWQCGTLEIPQNNGVMPTLYIRLAIQNNAVLSSPSPSISTATIWMMVVLFYPREQNVLHKLERDFSQLLKKLAHRIWGVAEGKDSEWLTKQQYSLRWYFGFLRSNPTKGVPTPTNSAPDTSWVSSSLPQFWYIYPKMVSCSIG